MRWAGERLRGDRPEPHAAARLRMRGTDALREPGGFEGNPLGRPPLLQPDTSWRHVALAGVASVTPPTVARTLNTCLPGALLTLRGDVHGLNGLTRSGRSPRCS